MCVSVCGGRGRKGEKRIIRVSWYQAFFNSYRLCVPFVLLIGGKALRRWREWASRERPEKFDCLMIRKINIKRLTSTSFDLHCIL